MLSDHYNEVVTTKRMTAIEVGGSKKNLQEVLNGVRCKIQPLTPEIARGLNVSFGKDFLMMCDNVDIQEGDRVFRNNGAKEYRVIGVENYDEFIGKAQHIEVIIRIFES